MPLPLSTTFARGRLSPGRVGAALLTFALIAPSNTRAQTIQNHGVNQAQVRLGFVGMVTNSVLISIVGSGTTTLSNPQDATMPTQAQATIDFGTFTSLLQPPPANGTGYRVLLPAPGAVLVATFEAFIDYNGATTASLTVGRAAPAGGPPDVPLGNLRVASPSLVSWSAGDQGVAVPNLGQPAFDICTATGDATCIAAKSYVHDLAIYLPDAQAAGPFSVTTLYTGTMP